jgi:hypothetical protein
MNKHLIFTQMKKTAFLLVLIICASSCGKSDKKDDQSLLHIEIGAALDNPKEFGASAIGTQVTYIPLETNDSVLVGKYPDVKVWKDKLIVRASNQPLMVFDRNTGKFLNHIGQIGDMPEGMSRESMSGIPHCWVDQQNGTVYLLAINGKDLLRYNLDGTFMGKCTPQIDSQYYLDDCYLYISNDIVTLQRKSFIYGNAPYISVFNGITGVLLNTVSAPDSYVSPPDYKTNYTGNVQYTINDPSHGSTVSQLWYLKEEQGYQTTLDSPSLWEYNGTRYVKEAFIDTIFALSASHRLAPNYVLDLGKWHWPQSKRYDMEVSKKYLYVGFLLESTKVIFFHLMQGFYKYRRDMVVDRYCGFYNKETKETHIKKGAFMRDDINQALTFSIRGISSDGEWFGMLQAVDVIEQLEKVSAEMKPEVKSLLSKVGEDDNPVVMLVK